MADMHALLAAVPVLAGARPVRALGGGEASDSWLLEGGDGPLMLRIDRPLAGRLGLDRGSEFEVLRAAHGAGLGPEPLYADPRGGVLVTRYLPGEPWRHADLDQPGRLERLGGLLREVHGLPVTGRRFDPSRIAEGYARALGPGNGAGGVDEVARLAEQLYPPGMTLRICHGDPNAANIIGYDRPRLIDWEYAAAGDPLYDLAVVSSFHGFDARRIELLLEAWSGRPAVENRSRLDGFMRLYESLTKLWQQVVSRHAGR